MCGIAGATGAGARSLVERMRDALAHRGPDGKGIFSDERIALGHRRLSIIDLSEAAAQPFASEDGSLQLVFNGEVYDYLELRSELEAKGRRFQSASDTEVILRGYEEWGERVFERLNGMFAIALYDARRKKLLLARDRAGEKPLHFGWLGDRFLFASELRAFKEAGRLAPSPLGVARFLCYDYVPAPDSPLLGFSRLAGGEALELDLETKKTRRWRYWRPRFQPKLALSLEEARDRLGELLTRSVKLRLRSDVPLGVFLSGGVDSSTVAAIARRLLGGAELRTYAIGFEDASFDESSHARRVAQHLGTRHTEEIVSERLLLETLPLVLAHQDEPLADSSILPTWLVSKLARRDVTVVLGGDGGDELFLGYDPFKAWRASRFYSALVPGFAHGALERAFSLVPRSQKRMSFEFRAKRFLRGAKSPEPVRLQAWLGSFTPEEARSLLRDDVQEMLYEPTARAWEEAEDELDRQSAVYLETYLQDGVLQKLDRATMAHALEARAPFLDPELMAFAFSLPGELKYAHFETKRVLKALARQLVPKEIVDRPKQGFGVPLGRWLQGPLLPRVQETLSPERVRAGGLLRPEAVSALLARHASGQADPRQVWSLLVLETWRASLVG
jgi:asparagine synthase (glutamine-hydrolysing)